MLLSVLNIKFYKLAFRFERLPIFLRCAFLSALNGFNLSAMSLERLDIRKCGIKALILYPTGLLSSYTLFRYSV